jgi:uncharacterized protein YcnI
MRTTGRIVTVTLLAASTLALVAGAAGAHVEPDPSSVKPGKTATVAFGVEHGCDKSPTTNLTFKVPKGATNVEPVAKDGWQTSVTDKTVVFEGGPLPADEPDEFSITFTAPSKKTELRWKLVQTCEKGTLRWIEKHESDDYPAPVVVIGKKADTKHDG